MIFGGLDLAAFPRNPSGMAVLRGRRFSVNTLYSDEDILRWFTEMRVNVVAIDAPLTLREDRYADIYLRRYGALSLKIPAMKELAIRGLKIKDELERKGIKVLEVFPTATAKILGFYSKPKLRMLSYFENFELPEVSNEHEVDAIIAAYTAYLYSRHLTRCVDGVVIPKGENSSCSSED